MTFTSKKPAKKLHTVFFAVLVLRLLIALFMWPGADEAYYYLYTLNPALSYFDHPPMVAIAGGLIPAIFNWVSSLSLRLGPIILFSLSIFSFYKAAGFLLSDGERDMATVIYMTVPMFFISGTILLPDAALLLFWTSGLWFFLKAVKSEKITDWILFGAAAGLGLLSKYTAGFLYIGAFLYLLSDKEKRGLLFSAGPALSILTGILFFMPVIIWNINHDFISFAFQTGRVGVGGIKFRYFYQSFFGQMGYLLPFFFIPALVYIFKSTVKIKNFKEDFSRFLFFFGVLPVLLFIFMSFFKRVLPHWPVIGYITLAFYVGRYYRGLLKRKPATFKLNAVLHVLLVVLVIGTVLLQIHTGFLFNREVESGRKAEKKDIRDITVDIIGWDKLDDYMAENSPKTDFIFTNKWYLAGQIGFALKGTYPLMVLSKAKDARGFILWQNQEKYLGKDGIFITTSKFYKDPELRYRDYFKDIKLLDTIEIYRSGKRVKIIYLYRCSNFIQTYPVK